jgi:hypothetical protein
MPENEIANLKPCKRAHYFVFVEFESPAYQSYEAMALSGVMCFFWDENSKGTFFKIELAYSSN